MNTKKIAALSKAIEMLENGFDYNWTSADRCNCGVVGRAMGMERNNFFGSAKSGGFILSAHYSMEVLLSDGERCRVTGLKLSDLQSAFLEHGFTKQDIINLENLTGEPTKITGELTKSDKDDLIKYLRAWVAILKEEVQTFELSAEALKERIVYVAVSEKISEQRKDLILN